MSELKAFYPLLPEDLPEGSPIPKCNDCGQELVKWSKDGCLLICKDCTPILLTPRIQESE